jgi:hypothetical protein
VAQAGAAGVRLPAAVTGMEAERALVVAPPAGPPGPAVALNDPWS